MPERAKPAARRAARRPDFNEGPVRRIFNAAVTAYENARGLNIGGAESGRRAKALAMKRKKNILVREDKLHD
jgi:hypothetical protein